MLAVPVARRPIQDMDVSADGGPDIGLDVRDAHLTIEAAFDACFDCRKTKRNSTNQLRFEADLESNLDLGAALAYSGPLPNTQPQGGYYAREE